MPINENPYSRIFYAVMSILKCIATKNIKECSVYFESDNWKTWKNILKLLLNLKLNLSDDPRRLFHDRNIETSPLICRGLYHIEASPLICSANQWTGFYMIETSITKEFWNVLFKSVGKVFYFLCKCIVTIIFFMRI